MGAGLLRVLPQTLLANVRHPACAVAGVPIVELVADGLAIRCARPETTACLVALSFAAIAQTLLACQSGQRGREIGSTQFVPTAK